MMDKEYGGAHMGMEISVVIVTKRNRMTVDNLYEIK